MKARIAWIGLDGHAHSSVLAWLDEEGRRQRHWRLPTSEAQVVKHLRQIPAAVKHLALEECGLGGWLAGVASPHVTSVLVCNPRCNRSISQHHHKCDEEDAYGLARLLRLGDLKAVWQPASPDRAVFKCAVQAYLDAEHRQTALKLQLKAHYRQWGVIPSGSQVYGVAGRCHWLQQLPEAAVREQLQLLYTALDCAREVLKATKTCAPMRPTPGTVCSRAISGKCWPRRPSAQVRRQN